MAAPGLPAWLEVVRLLKRSLAAAAVTAAGLGLASAAYQTWQSARDRLRYLPPGDLINIGQRRIHLWAWNTDKNSPTIVIVPALGTSCLDFSCLMPHLTGTADEAIVVFDRAGLGWSDPSSDPNALLMAPTDLRRALSRARIEPPYVLVGHSIGAYIVRLFAADNPNEVAGVVLIDPSHHDQYQRFPHYLRRVLLRYLSDRLRPYGLARLARDAKRAATRRFTSHRYLPQVWDRHLDAVKINDRHRRADLRELLAWPALAEMAGRDAPSLGNIPLTVISSSEFNPNCATEKDIEKRRAHYKIWYPMQVELAGLSTDSKHVVAENAGHYVHRFQPELVADAILDMVRRARR